MKYASSIRFGGQLIDAKDCGYEDYKRLGLLCPECKDPVFLKAEGARQQGGKEVKIGAHFSHFATKNPELAKVCESRIKGYTQADVDRAIAKAKGQRLKLLQRWFWDVFMNRGCLSKAYDDRLLEYRHSFKSKQHRTQGVLNKVHLFVFKGIDDLDDVIRRLRAIALQYVHPSDLDLKNALTEVEELVMCAEGCHTVGGHDISEVLCESHGPLFPLDKIQIGCEVVDFLLASRQKELLLEICQMWELTQIAIVMNEESSEYVRHIFSFRNLLNEYFGWGLDYGDNSWLINEIKESVARLIFADLIYIPWADEFARLSAKPKAGAA